MSPASRLVAPVLRSPKRLSRMLSSVLFRRILKLSLPVVFLSGTETLDHLINSAFTARLGVAELGAIGVADTLFFLFLAAPLALVNGIQIVTAQRVGQRDPGGIAAAFNQGLAVILLLSLLLTVLLKIASPYLAAWFIASEDVATLLDDFLQIGAYGIAVTGATYAYSALLISLGRTWVLVPCTVILVVVNVAVNYLVVFGNFGFPALGIRGVALGLVAAEVCGFAFLTVYLWLRVRSPQCPLFRFGQFKAGVTSLIARVSAPIGVEVVLNTSRWLIFFLILERIGTGALAVGNVVYTCYTVFSVPLAGFEETTCSMVGRLVGRKRAHQIGELLTNAAAGAVLTTAPLIVLAVFVPQWILSPFLPDDEILGDSSAAVRVMGLAMLVGIPRTLWTSAVMGTGDTPGVLTIELALTAAMLGLAYLAAAVLELPVAAVWLSVPIAWAVGFGLSYGWIRSRIWQRVRL